MKTIKMQEVFSNITEESKIDLVVEINGRTHIGALMFEMMDDEELREVKAQIELPDETSNEDFVEAIVNFYTANAEKVYESTAGTIKHWFSMNGVGRPAFVFVPENYSNEITVQNRTFRYNKKAAVLEYIDSKKRVVATIGLSREEAADEESLQYWCEQWNDELNIEVAEAIKEFQK